VKRWLKHLDKIPAKEYHPYQLTYALNRPFFMTLLNSCIDVSPTTPTEFFIGMSVYIGGIVYGLFGPLGKRKNATESIKEMDAKDEQWRTTENLILN
jgi:hypothetical protein